LFPQSKSDDQYYQENSQPPETLLPGNIMNRIRHGLLGHDIDGWEQSTHQDENDHEKKVYQHGCLLFV
jgi:hypothetical protein